MKAIKNQNMISWTTRGIDSVSKVSNEDVDVEDSLIFVRRDRSRFRQSKRTRDQKEIKQLQKENDY